MEHTTFKGILNSADASTAVEIPLFKPGTQGDVVPVDAATELRLDQVLLRVGPSAGDGAGYLVNGASFVAGNETISVDGGTGTMLVGDTFRIAGETVDFTVTSALSGGSVSFYPPLSVTLADNAVVSSPKPGATVANDVRLFLSTDGSGTDAWRTIFRGILVDSDIKLDLATLRLPRSFSLWVETDAVGQVDATVTGTVIQL